jgi:NAD(P)-dependent dehydrogenase (short-subunit alcohol dehydrogenase family)
MTCSKRQHTAAIPHLVEQDTGGSVILISSMAGLKGTPNTIHYTASKHAVVGMMKTLANELGPHMVRVNTIHPNTVATPMMLNDRLFRLMRPDLEEPTREDAIPVLSGMTAMPVPWAEPGRRFQRRAVPRLRRVAIRQRRETASMPAARSSNPGVTPPAARWSRCRRDPGARGTVASCTTTTSSRPWRFTT